MVMRIVVVAAVLTMLLGAVACSERETSIELAYGDFANDTDVRRTIEVAPGSDFEVSLFTNPQSGFEWSEAQISAETVLSQRSREFVPLYGEQPHEDEPSGLDVFTFEALCKGQSTVEFLYSRPWEGGQRGVWTFTLLVNVA